MIIFILAPCAYEFGETFGFDVFVHVPLDSVESNELASGSVQCEGSAADRACSETKNVKVERERSQSRSPKDRRRNSISEKGKCVASDGAVKEGFKSICDESDNKECSTTVSNDSENKEHSSTVEVREDRKSSIVSDEGKNNECGSWGDVETEGNEDGLNDKVTDSGQVKTIKPDFRRKSVAHCLANGKKISDLHIIDQRKRSKSVNGIFDVTHFEDRKESDVGNSDFVNEGRLKCKLPRSISEFEEIADIEGEVVGKRSRRNSVENDADVLLMTNSEFVLTKSEDDDEEDDNDDHDNENENETDDHDETDSKDESYSEKEFCDRQEKKLISDIISNITGKRCFAFNFFFFSQVSALLMP